MIKIKPFPKLAQLPGSNVCGAYCVAATLDAFGLFPMVLPFQINSFFGKQLSIPRNISLKTFADHIYLITGILDPVKSSKYIESNGLNSLAAMAYVLKKCNLNVKVFFKDKSAFESLKEVYPNEIELLRSKITVSSFLNERVSTALNNIVIYAIQHDSGGTHYVANNERGEWFDPAAINDDILFKSFVTIEEFTEQNGWKWLGVCLNISLEDI